VACRSGFFLPVRVLSRLFRRLFLEKLVVAHDAGRLQFFGNHAALTDAQAFAAYLTPLRNAEWVVYSKRPFGGPKAVLAYLARYTHRVAISNSRLIALGDNGVTFRWKDYRADSHERQKVMTLTTGEFIRRFLSHVLPTGFHRIRHYGLFASGTRADNVARARELLAVPKARNDTASTTCADASEPQTLSHPCPCCGGRMIVIETFERGGSPRYRPAGIPNRDQDRHLMIAVARQHHKPADQLHRSSTGSQIARPRSNFGCRLVNKSPLNAGSAHPIKPANLLDRVRKTRSTNLAHTPPATKSP
jgi:hypothetical protein